MIDSYISIEILDLQIYYDESFLSIWTFVVKCINEILLFSFYYIYLYTKYYKYKHIYF